MRDPATMTWRGRPLDDLTREELMEVVLTLQQQFERSHENFMAIAELNKKMLERMNITERARREAEKFRIYALNIALATRSGNDGDLRIATQMLIDEVATKLCAEREEGIRVGLDQIEKHGHHIERKSA